MQIELRNVKYSAFASEETHCFRADIWIDGTKAGTAENQGHGGPTMIHPRALHERLDAYGATLPTISAYGMEIQPDGEILIGDLVNDWLIERDVRRAMGRKVLFTKPGDHRVFETKSMTADQKDRVLQRPDLMTALKADKVLNLLPLADAIALYKQAVDARA